MTADPFLDIESSREGSSVVDLYQIITSTGQAWYLTSAIRDVTWDGRVYKATAIDRGEVGVDTVSDARALDVSIAIDHPLVKRWTTYGVPPKRTTITVYELQFDDDVAEFLWEGEVTSLAWEKGVAKLRVPGRLSDALQRKVPNVSCSTLCTHLLYDGNCGVLESASSPGGLAHRVTTPVITVDGREVTVDLGTVDRNGTWSENGKLRHVATGEMMTIGKQYDLSPGVNGKARLTIQARIAELKVGDSVMILRGCKNTILDCRDGFGNVSKFAGYPDLPQSNPFKTGSL